MQSLLTFAGELECRDGAIARALADVEELQVDVDEVRRNAELASAFLASAPERRTTHQEEERAAVAARTAAETALRRAEEQIAEARKDDERLEAMRGRQDALDAIRAADRWREQARAALVEDEDEAERWLRVQAEVAARAAEITPRIPDLSAPGDGLDGTLDWAARARGTLLLERSNLAREREAIIREAAELTASVLGEPLVSGAVAGLRDRLARDIAE